MTRKLKDGTLCHECVTHPASLRILSVPYCNACAVENFKRFTKEAEATDAH